MTQEHISLDIRRVLKQKEQETSKEQALSLWSALFEQTLGLSFNSHFLEAFTHRSFQNEYADFQFTNYERLEFLGDSILQTWVTTKLFKSFSNAEGKLSILRSSIVNEKSLSEIALVLKLEKLILLGKGEALSKGYLKSSLLCDVFEAMLGAHYLTCSQIEKTFEFLDEVFAKAQTKGINLFSEDNADDFDEKTKLQNIVMKRFKAPPVYQTKELNNGDFKYEVSLIIEDKEIFKANTNSVKKTQKQLAREALDSNIIKEILDNSKEVTNNAIN